MSTLLHFAESLKSFADATFNDAWVNKLKTRYGTVSLTIPDEEGIKTAFHDYFSEPTFARKLADKVNLPSDSDTVKVRDVNHKLDNDYLYESDTAAAGVDCAEVWLTTQVQTKKKDSTQSCFQDTIYPLYGAWIPGRGWEISTDL